MSHPTRRPLGLGLCFLTLTGVLAACGGDSGTDTSSSTTSSSTGTGSATGSQTSSAADTGSGEKQSVKVQLQWVTQAQFACYYAAKDQGLYDKYGLDVEILPGATDIVPIDVLTSGGADYAVSWVPKVLGAVEQGARVTDVAQIFQRSGTTQISFKDKNITKPADLKGKKVGSWGYGNEFELFAGMQKNGVQIKDIELVQQAFDMNGFLSGDIDAAQAMTYNEYAQVLESKNPATGELYKPEDLNVINWNDAGSAMLQDAIWADADKLANDEQYKKNTVNFIAGTIAGCAYARDNAEQAAKIVTAAGSQLGESHQLWMTNEINKLIWPSPNGAGMIDEAMWKQTVEISKGTKNESDATIISADPPADAYSNEYVTEALKLLEADGVDTKGSGFTGIDVTLNEGGK